MSGHALIELRNIDKVYATGRLAFHALRGIDLRIEAGEYVALIGPSGSGKSTLMNIIGCLDVPSSGQYLLDGIDVSQLAQDPLAEIRSKKIGFIFQSFNLLSRLSALDNVELPLLYQRVDDSRQRARDALERVGLGPWVDHRPTEMSGGQRQRVAIARALVGGSPILLADEPTGNLDSATGSEILEMFDGLHDSGVTLLVVTHDPEVGERARRIVAVRDGRIERDSRHEVPTS